MFRRGFSQLLSMHQRVLQGEGVTTRQSVKYTDQSGTSFNDPTEVSLANILPGALEADQVRMSEAVRCLMLAEEPSQHISEDFNERMSEDSNNCGSIPRRIADQEHRARVTEASLKQNDAPMTSKMGDGTFHLSPRDTLGSSQGPTRNTIDIPIVPVDGMILAAQLKEYILGAIKGHEDREAPSYTYIKPYSSFVPKQHVTYFVEICNNAGTERDEMVKQFIPSLKVNAFDMYTNLEPASIDGLGSTGKGIPQSLLQYKEES
ncbi:hypothetical protein LIER_12783 [Lithospermum erythrorhizon]|uniref:Uncharacterized protein n=1 Tax=Lithospermum erythrorhizon TaxID=34254 RepID=A0AAV3PW67_LITER